VQAGKSHSQHHQGSAGTYAQVLHFQPRIPTDKKTRFQHRKKPASIIFKYNNQLFLFFHTRLDPQ